MTASRADAALGRQAALEAVLLDVDGTLVDSTDAHAQAWSDAFKEAGFQIGSEAVRPLVGMGSDKLLPKLTSLDAESEEGKRLIERRMEIFMREYLPAIRPFPRARDLLECLRADGYTLVVATSANEDELHGLIKLLGAEWLLDEATSSDDAERSKPDPDIVRAAVDKAGVGPASCVMLGDTPYDVEAATRAGVRIVGVRSGGWGDEDLKGAIAIYDDTKDILEHYEESVFGNRASGEARTARRHEGREHRGGSQVQAASEGSSHVEGA